MKMPPKMHKQTIDLTGQQFGQLLVLAYAGRRKKRTYWTCKCLACGSVKDYYIGNLRSGQSTQCFHCPAKPRKKASYQRHLQPGYRTWKKMVGSGEACKRWLNFEKFIADMGEPPKGKGRLLRLDNTKPYSRTNCLWISNGNIRMLTHNGRTMSVCDWARELGLSHQTIRVRLKKMPVEEALTKIDWRLRIMHEEEKAVVDRIEEGKHAVLLIGEDEREFSVLVERLPEGTGAGSWLRVRVEGSELAILGTDQGEEEAAKQRIEDKMARLRQRGSRLRPAGSEEANETGGDSLTPPSPPKTPLD